jgi:hypothetical protein
MPYKSHTGHRAEHGDLQLSLQTVGAIALSLGGLLVQASRLPNRFREVLGEVTDVAASLFGAPQNALDVHL